MSERALVRVLSWTLTALALTPLSTGRVHGQSQADATQEAPLFGVSSAVVQVDVVVRDNRGRAVRDLTAEDFAVFEDGQPQAIQSFRIVQLDALPRGQRVEARPAAVPAAAPDAGAAAPAEAPPEAAQPQVIVFIFDRLSTNGRDTAHKAATRYLSSGHVEGDIVAVFAIDQALHLLQNFTADREEIKAAFDRGLTRASTDYASTRQDARDAGARAQALDEQSQGASTPEAAANLAVEAGFAAMEERMAAGFDRLERDQQGYATTNGLLAVVDGLKPIPGRKTIVFFSEGLSLPNNVLAQFRSVIATANRAQVSVYAVDAGGLRTESTQRESREQLQAYARRRERQEASGTFGRGDSGPMTAQMERVEDSMRFNSQSGLGQLAEETGGFLVADTNDASEGFERIQEDMRFHYMLAYTPTNPSYDGRFRNIKVDVNRKNVRVQSRKGYFAVPPDVVVPVRSFEAPAIAALDAHPRPHAFPLKATALSFPEKSRPGRISIFASMPVSAVAFKAPTSEGQTAHMADFSVLVRLSDENGNEVDRVSQQYPLSVPSESLESAKKGDVLFYKEADLSPGRYKVEAVAHDAIAGTSSVVESRVEVPGTAAGGLRLSTLTLVRRAEKLPPEEQKSDNPLIFGEMMLYPNLGGEAYSKKTPMAFYFTAYGAGDGTQCTIELLQNGQVAAALPTPLPAPDARGRIQYAGTLPLDALPPAEYGLRVTVTHGGDTASRETLFTVTP